MTHVVIIGLIIMAATVVGFAARIPSVAACRVSAARTQIEACVGGLERFKADYGRYPTTEEGLSAIRPYMEKDVPPDPWGRAYVYRGSEHPTLVSLGADGLPGGSGVNLDWRWTNH